MATTPTTAQQHVSRQASEGDSSLPSTGAPQKTRGPVIQQAIDSLVSGDQPASLSRDRAPTVSLKGLKHGNTKELQRSFEATSRKASGDVPPHASQVRLTPTTASQYAKSAGDKLTALHPPQSYSNPADANNVRTQETARVFEQLEGALTSGRMDASLAKATHDHCGVDVKWLQAQNDGPVMQHLNAASDQLKKLCQQKADLEKSTASISGTIRKDFDGFVQAKDQAQIAFTQARKDLEDARAPIHQANKELLQAKNVLRRADKSLNDASGALKKAHKSLADAIATQPPLDPAKITALESAVAKAQSAVDKATLSQAQAKETVTSLQQKLQTIVQANNDKVTAAELVFSQATTTLEKAQQTFNTQTRTPPLSDLRALQDLNTRIKGTQQTIDIALQLISSGTLVDVASFLTLPTHFLMGKDGVTSRQRTAEPGTPVQVISGGRKSDASLEGYTVPLSQEEALNPHANFGRVVGDILGNSGSAGVVGPDGKMGGNPATDRVILAFRDSTGRIVDPANLPTDYQGPLEMVYLSMERPLDIPPGDTKMRYGIQGGGMYNRDLDDLKKAFASIENARARGVNIELKPASKADVAQATDKVWSGYQQEIEHYHAKIAENPSLAGNLPKWIAVTCEKHGIDPASVNEKGLANRGVLLADRLSPKGKERVDHLSRFNANQEVVDQYGRAANEYKEFVEENLVIDNPQLQAKYDAYEAWRKATASPSELSDMHEFENKIKTAFFEGARVSETEPKKLEIDIQAQQAANNFLGDILANGLDSSKGIVLNDLRNSANRQMTTHARTILLSTEMGYPNGWAVGDTAEAGEKAYRGTRKEHATFASHYKIQLYSQASLALHAAANGTPWAPEALAVLEGDAQYAREEAREIALKGRVP